MNTSPPSHPRSSASHPSTRRAKTRFLCQNELPTTRRYGLPARGRAAASWTRAAVEMIDAERDDSGSVELQNAFARGIDRSMQGEESNAVGKVGRGGVRAAVVTGTRDVVVRESAVPDHVLVRYHETLGDEQAVCKLVQRRDLIRPVENIRSPDVARSHERDPVASLRQRG